MRREGRFRLWERRPRLWERSPDRDVPEPFAIRRSLLQGIAIGRSLPLALLLLAAGCGFHLRTWDVGTSIETAYVTSNPRNPLEAPLTRALRQAGVELTGSAGEAQIVVQLLDSRRDRRSISVSDQARAAEYETILGVQYRVVDGQGRELLPTQWLQRERVFQVDRNNIVGSSSEQALLEREMQSDLVQQILRALNTVVTENPGADQAD